MRIITRDEFHSEKDSFLREIAHGAVFIHPTDTIYGIGCDATQQSAVSKIREAKQRYSKPFSVIAPSKEWIVQNCVVRKEAIKWLNKLPGPYTLVLKLKNKSGIAPQTNPGVDTLGVRIPDHWFSEVAKDFGKPLITTSANIVGKEFMTSLDNLDPAIKSHMKLAFYEGEKNGKPSTIVNLTGKKEEIIKR
jgi:L-threonylcarbamoyladenylate synthase